MSNPTITNGRVFLEDGIKAKEEYAPARKAAVEIFFSVEENGLSAEAVIAAAGDLAISHVARLLGTTAPVAQTPPATRGKAKPKDEPKTPPAETVDDAASMVETKVEKPVKDESAIVDDEAAVNFDEVIAPAADESAIVDEPAETITDADLNNKVTAKNGELKDPPKIRAFIASFNPDPTKGFQLSQVPQERRKEFLDKLAELK